MPISPVNLTIQLTTSDACDALYLSDITGTVGVDDNVDGYGVSGGPAVNDVDTVTVLCTYNSAGTYITYVFTVANGVITACTLAIQTGTPADIFAELTSTAWPFTTTTPFNLFGDYGVTVPAFTDEIFTVEYTIEGDVSAVDFDFSTIENKAIVCNAQCCVDKKFLDIDWSCECSAADSKTAMYGQALINNVLAAETSTGNLAVAISALDKLSILCGSTTSGGCGCS